MRLLILRGDLQSHAGYSAAARAYGRQLAPSFDRVVGVDLHFAPNRPFEPFPHPLVSDAQANALACSSPFALALTISTPHEYVRTPGAINVGVTFWECDRFPLDPATGLSAVARANQMDALWAPSSHTRAVFEAAGVTPPVRIIPWPLQVFRQPVAGLPEGEVFDLDRCRRSTAILSAMVEAGGTRLLARGARALAGRTFLAQLRVSSQSIAAPATHAFLCVAQDCPRKALLLMLAEWLEFKRRPEAAPWTLILKSSPADPGQPRADFVARFWRHVQALRRQLGVRRTRVYLWADDLTTAACERLQAATFAHIAPALGEGFCGPAVAALAQGKPLVAPRHTAFTDYLSPDYPYSYATRPAIVRFAGDAPAVYDPASAWEVPEPFGIADALTRLVGDCPARRRAVSEQTRDQVRAWCRPQRVQRLLEAELARLEHGITRASQVVV